MTRANRPAPRDAPQVLRSINRNTRINESSGLPVIAVANVRSLLPKLNSFIEKIQNESISLCLISEIWEKKGKKNAHFQSKTEEIMEMHGYKYVSCGARPSGKRGGGAAILTDLRKSTVEQIEVNIPSNLEVKWALIRPKQIDQGTKYREVIVSSFYSAPNSKKHRVLLDHGGCTSCGSGSCRSTQDADKNNITCTSMPGPFPASPPRVPMQCPLPAPRTWRGARGKRLPASRDRRPSAITAPPQPLARTRGPSQPAFLFTVLQGRQS